MSLEEHRARVRAQAQALVWRTTREGGRERVGGGWKRRKDEEEEEEEEEDKVNIYNTFYDFPFSKQDMRENRKRERVKVEVEMVYI